MMILDEIVTTADVNTTQNLSRIDGYVDGAIAELMEATPISETRRLYLAGTHKDHGATKKGWKAKRKQKASLVKYDIVNTKPDRVRLVEHGFTRPAIKGKKMAWQMIYDEKLQTKSAIKPYTFEGLFFVAKQKTKLADMAGGLYSGINLFDEIIVDYGDDYTL